MIVNGKINMKLKINDIVNRYKEAESIKADRQLADIIGISPQDFAAKKKRGTILITIIEFGINKNIDLNWLLTGKNIFLSGSKHYIATPPVDQQLLSRVIEFVEEQLELSERHLEAGEKADLIVQTYEAFTERSKVKKSNKINKEGKAKAEG